ncbi:FMN-binding protein [Aeromicrobium phragmitis]|nr:FMN-binding protein [Aeromicrobium phragmitis]
MERPTARTALYAATAASTALLAAACGPQTEQVESAPSPSASAEAKGASEGAASFSAGDYEATGSYQTPGGTQSVDVEVTLEADGTITDVEVDGNAEGGNSEQFQEKFESGIEAEVEGKKITELSVDKVSGSSLTSGGFNDAITQIIDDAQA